MTNDRRNRALINFLLILQLTVGAAVAAMGQTIYGLSGNMLISFEAATPGTLTSSATITGIAADQKLVGIDFRPATGELFGLGYNNTTGQARLYIINLSTGVATPVGMTTVSLLAGMGNVGFDFNPTVDRIRVTGSNGANYRLNPITGGIAATDTNLAFAGTDVNAGQTPNINAVAYTNSYIGTTTTTLFNYDANLNILTTQIPPNNGTLNTQDTLNASFAAGSSIDFDVYFDPTTKTNQAYFVGTPAGGSESMFYIFNTTTSTLTPVGMFAAGMMVDDIAVRIQRNVPATVQGDLIYGLTANNSLVTFDSQQPDIIRSLVAVTGLATGQQLVGIDFRPATGELFGLGYNSTTGEARLYIINKSTGVATAVGTTTTQLMPNMGQVGFDFNPTVDRIRVTGTNGANYRLNPTTGAIAATDTNLAFAGTDVNAGATPAIGAVAYTNSFSGSTTTTLYNYDNTLNIFTTQIPPNNGTLNTLGASGITLNTTDLTADIDIYYDATTQTNRAYLSANTGTQTNDNLYSVNLTTGAATLIGPIGLGIPIIDIAVEIKAAVNQISFTACKDTTVTAAEGAFSTIVNYSIPTATTGNPAGGLTVTLLSGPASGSSFPGGATQVCYRATDASGASDTCCFMVRVNEAACDAKGVGCLRWELLSVQRNAQGDKVYRVRLNSKCSSALTYVTFQVPKGLEAMAPANNSVYTAPSGRTYRVRTPNHNPTYSIRFKTQGAALTNGQSDIFQYTIPEQSDMLFIYSFARLDDGTGLEVHLNTFDCPVTKQTQLIATKPNSFSGSQLMPVSSANGELVVFPNPTNGNVWVDASAWAGQRVALNVISATGQLVMRTEMEASTDASLLEMPDLSNGLYFLELHPVDGSSRETVRFTVQK